MLISKSWRLLPVKCSSTKAYSSVHELLYTSLQLTSQISMFVILLSYFDREIFCSLFDTNLALNGTYLDSEELLFSSKSISIGLSLAEDKRGVFSLAIII